MLLLLASTKCMPLVCPKMVLLFTYSCLCNTIVLAHIFFLFSLHHQVHDASSHQEAWSQCWLLCPDRWRWRQDCDRAASPPKTFPFLPPFWVQRSWQQCCFCVSSCWHKNWHFKDGVFQYSHPNFQRSVLPDRNGAPRKGLPCNSCNSTRPKQSRNCALHLWTWADPKRTVSGMPDWSRSPVTGYCSSSAQCTNHSESIFFLQQFWFTSIQCCRPFDPAAPAAAYFSKCSQVWATAPWPAWHQLPASQSPAQRVHFQYYPAATYSSQIPTSPLLSSLSSVPSPLVGGLSVHWKAQQGPCHTTAEVLHSRIPPTTSFCAPTNQEHPEVHVRPQIPQPHCWWTHQGETCPLSTTSTPEPGIVTRIT